MKAQVFDNTGAKINEIELSETLFNAGLNPNLIAQAVRVFLANQRQGNAHTKSRGDVTGSTRKIYKQKGTGNARHGDIKAPVFVGGGVVFGPVHHSFKLSMPKKMRDAALLSALSTKSDAIAVIVGMNDFDGKTKTMKKLLDVVASDKRKTMMVLSDGMDKVIQSLRNVDSIDYVNALDLNTYEVMNHDYFIFSQEALEVLEKRVGR
ncbi:MAG: 50S ribosomal protein L4 [bacterium]|nr:50S ribosomal protein L4 [bacterium]